MIQVIEQAVLEALTGAGLHAVRRFPNCSLDKHTPTVTVGVSSGTVDGGFSNYLGVRFQEGVPVEVYGQKTDVTIELDVYVPAGEAETCGALLAQVQQGIYALPGGLRARRITQGQPERDPGTGMFRCPCTLECTAYFVSTAQEDGEIWTDFVLRGVLEKHERE